MSFFAFVGVFFLVVVAFVIAMLVRDVVRMSLRAYRVTKVFMSTLPRQGIIDRQGRRKWYWEWMGTFLNELKSHPYDTATFNGVTVRWNGTVVTQPPA